MRTKNQLIVAALFLVLGAVGIIMNSRQAAAKAPPMASRSVVDPLPVPITGSSTIAGTVGVTQSGVWNVGITGQPVNIRNIDEPGRAPYQETLRAQGGSACGTVVCGPQFVFSPVPANKRLVITHVSVSFVVSTGGMVCRWIAAERTALRGRAAALHTAGAILPRERPVGDESTGDLLRGAVAESIVFASVDTPHISNEQSFATIAGYYISLP